MQEIFIHDPQVQHLLDPFPKEQNIAAFSIETLPYSLLGGPGLEKLCFDLLRIKEKQPKIFGKPGQAQFGIDLLVDDGSKTQVYQCKNLAKPPSPSEFEEALNKFASEWPLSGQPFPTEFVYVCPQPMNDRELVLKSASSRPFTVKFWCLNFLNGELRNYPDLVSLYFSREVAKVFCSCDIDDLFIPLRSADDIPKINQQEKMQGIWIPEREQAAFHQLLDEHPVIWVQGPPGLGKTWTYTEMARCYQGTRRCFYLDIKTIWVEEGVSLRTGIEARKHLPSIFILDNCHEKEDLVTQLVLYRLGKTLGSADIKLVCIARFSKATIEQANLSELASELEERGALINLSQDEKRFKDYLLWARPDWPHLRESRVKRLRELSGDNFMILDQLLGACNDQNEVDDLDLDQAVNVFAKKYLKISLHAPNLLRLAALAQFEIAPQLSWLSLNEDEQRVGKSLMVVAGAPARYYFLHGSSAELAFHALAGKEGKAWRSCLSQVLEDFAQNLHQELQLKNVDFVTGFFQKLRQGSLALTPQDQLRAIYLDLVFKPQVLGILKTLALNLCHWRALTGAVFEAGRGQHPDFPGVCDELIAMVKDEIISGRGAGLQLAETLYYLTRMINDLRPEARAGWSTWLVEAKILDFFAKHGSWVSLCQTFANMHDPLVLINQLNSDHMASLMEISRQANHSIGTLDLALRELNPDVKRAFEEKLGAARILVLIQGNGTLFELFRIMASSSLAMAQEVVESLNDEILERLLQKTVASGRSIGTLGLALRELNPDVKRAFEEKLGAARILVLIQGNGTLFELFMIMKSSSLAMAQETVEGLNDEILERLLQKTVASGRSIGTLGLALRALNPDVKRAFEEKLGSKRFWILMGSLGSLRILSNWQRDMSETYAKECLWSGRGFDESYWNALLCRGNFRDVALMVKECPYLAEMESLPVFMGCLEASLPQLIDQTDWAELNRARKIFAYAKGPTASLGNKVFGDFIIGLNLPLPKQTSFSHAVNAFSCLMDYRFPREDQALTFEALFPDAKEWRNEDVALKTLSYLMDLMCREDAQFSLVQKVWVEGTEAKWYQHIEKEKLDDLFSITWERFSLWLERFRDGGDDRFQLFSTGSDEAIKAVMITRLVKCRSYEIWYGLVMLAGLFGFMKVSTPKKVLFELRRDPKRCRFGFDGLLKRYGFFKTYFILHGLKMLFPKRVVIRTIHWQLLLEASREFEYETRALKLLRFEIANSRGR